MTGKIKNNSREKGGGVGGETRKKEEKKWKRTRTKIGKKSVPTSSIFRFT